MFKIAMSAITGTLLGFATAELCTGHLEVSIGAILAATMSLLLRVAVTEP